MALLEIHDLNTYYGKIHALQGVSITVDEGEIVTLIGANGAGKTTTLMTICGVVAARQGVGFVAGLIQNDLILLDLLNNDLHRGQALGVLDQRSPAFHQFDHPFLDQS